MYMWPWMKIAGLLQILCRLEANGLAVVGSEHAGPLDRIALALYPTASIMNHACTPDLVLHFAGRSLTASILPLMGTELWAHCPLCNLQHALFFAELQILLSLYRASLRCWPMYARCKSHMTDPQPANILLRPDAVNAQPGLDPMFHSKFAMPGSISAGEAMTSLQTVPCQATSLLGRAVEHVTALPCNRYHQGVAL